MSPPKGLFYWKMTQPGERKLNLGNLRHWASALSLCLFLGGCTQTYPSHRVKESIQEICRKEYGIENIDVKITGKTIGVYLPIKKLFATDLKEILTKGGGKVADVENLFRPSPEALDQVEDVLFSISRVLLSTDLKLEFYMLQATDVYETGLQLILVGYVDDIKRVRLWDISREEYRKRVLHEIRLNRAAIWHRPVHSFFKELEKSPSPKTVAPYFAAPVSSSLFESVFFMNPETVRGKPVEWHLGELRSLALAANQVLVYAPATVEYDSRTMTPGAVKIPSGTPVEYLFIVSFGSEPPKISRVIPLSLADEQGRIQKIPIPEELNIRKDIESWEKEFSFSEIHLGDFLAEQLTRRTQALLFSDERIQNTFERVQVNFHYHRESAKSYFSLELDLKLKTATPWTSTPSALQEDALYLLTLSSREFVEVLRSYQFSDYEFLELNLASESVSHILAREDLELFRRNKADLAGLLGRVSPL